jgi:hypothetical protein
MSCGNLYRRFRDGDREAGRSVASGTKTVDLALGLVIVGLIAAALWQFYALIGFNV